MYCSKCGYYISSNDIFCSHCGNKIKLSQEDKIVAYYKNAINFLYSEIEEIISPNDNTKYIKAYKGNICTLLNIDCVQIIPEYYEDIKPNTGIDGTLLFCIKRNGKWGLRTKHKTIIPFIYDNMTWDFFANDLPGYCTIESNSKKGIINADTGEVIFDCLFESFSYDHRYEDLDKHIFAVRYNGKYGLINIKTCKKIIPFEYNNHKEAFDAYCKAKHSALMQFRPSSLFSKMKPLTEEELNIIRLKIKNGEL